MATASLLPEPVLAELQSRGVLDARGQLTPLGRTVGYHLHESSRQSEHPDLHRRLIDGPVPGAGAAILDIGCGAGQTLRHLPGSFPASAWGSTSIRSPGLGSRLAGIDRQPTWFVQGDSDPAAVPGLVLHSRV